MLKILRLVCVQRPFLNVARQLSYKSDISTAVLYPTSKQKLFTPPPPPPVSTIEFAFFLPKSDK